MKRISPQMIGMYLGCEAIIERTFAPKAKIKDKVTASTITMSQDIEIMVKLCLRPLSDATGHDAKLWSMQTIESHGDWSDLSTHEFRPSLLDIPVLLKQGFDLFGLIESGLAIDKTKQK